MSDASDYCEKAFKTTMSLDSFQKIAQRSCRDPFWATAEGRDRSEIPFTNILSIVFSTIEDRDRFIIAMRFASGEKIPANNERPRQKICLYVQLPKPVDRTLLHKATQIAKTV